MIAVDTNLLVYAHRRESRVHTPARAIMRRLAEGDDAWAIPWPCCYEFPSVVTNRRIWKDAATTVERAWRQLDAWTSSPSSRLLSETDDFLDLLSGFIQRPRVHGAVVHDARVAALCVAHGAEALLTCDRAFRCFQSFGRAIRSYPGGHESLLRSRASAGQAGDTQSPTRGLSGAGQRVRR